MGIKDKLLKTKENLSEDIGALKGNKKIDVDRAELNKRVEEADKKRQKELDDIKSTVKEQKDKPSEYHAMIRLYIISGTKREQIGYLGAFFGHKEGKQTLKVINKDKEVIFEEIKPDWQNVYRHSDKESLETRRANIQSILKQFQNKEIVEKKDEKGIVYYEEDYIAMLRQIEQEYSILVLGSEGTYSESVNGLEEYSFDIVGFFKIPMFYYTSKSILGLPPAPKIIVGQYLDEILNKDYMADKERATRIIVMITVIGFVIALIATIYIMYHFTQPMVELAQSNADMAQSYASSLNISDVLHNISEKIGVSNSLLDNSGTPIQNITTIMK